MDHGGGSSHTTASTAPVVRSAVARSLFDEQRWFNDDSASQWRFRDIFRWWKALLPSYLLRIASRVLEGSPSILFAQNSLTDVAGFSFHPICSE
jgi:hypothetical protein